VSRVRFGSLSWRSRSQHDLAAKSCPANNFVIWSRISKIFHRNDHHIETTCRAQHLSHYLEGQGHSMTLQQNPVRPITLLFEVRFRNNFTERITILRRRVACNIWAATLKVKFTAWPFSKVVSGPKLCYLKSDFRNILHNWSPYWHELSRGTFGSLPWRSRSQHDLSAKLFTAHNFVIWSRILQLFHRNDHHIETTCRVQHLGCYLKGQGHSMTLQQNRVWSKTLLFEVGLYNYFWQTTSLCPIPIRGALPGSDRLLFKISIGAHNRKTALLITYTFIAYWKTKNKTST